MPETTTQETGADARAVNEQALAAAREEAVQAERQRVSEIQSLSAVATKYGIDGAVISEFIAKGVSVDQARKELFDRLAEEGRAGHASSSGAKAPEFRFATERPVTRDGAGDSASPACRWRCCSAPTAASSWRGAATTTATTSANISDGCGPEQQQRALGHGARVPQFQAHRHGQGVPGVERRLPVRGMDVTRIAELALQGSFARARSSSRAAPNPLRTSRRSWPTSPTRPCARATRLIRARSSRSAGR